MKEIPIKTMNIQICYHISVIFNSAAEAFFQFQQGLKYQVENELDAFRLSCVKKL